MRKQLQWSLWKTQEFRVREVEFTRGRTGSVRQRPTAVLLSEMIITNRISIHLQEGNKITLSESSDNTHVLTCCTTQMLSESGGWGGGCILCGPNKKARDTRTPKGLLTDKD